MFLDNLQTLNNFHILLGLICFFISNYITKTTIPLSKNIALKLNIFDLPSFRSQHSVPMIRLGGISIFNGFLACVLIIFLSNEIFNLSFNFKNEFFQIFLGSSFMFILGLIDDLFQINPFIRLISQFLIASIVFMKGLSFNVIDLSLINSNLFYPLTHNINYIFSIFWIVGITNAINWIDGLDGLASGICAILFSSLFIVNILNQNYIISILCLGVIGCCIGFLKYNSYPAKIFMGDGGSYFLGFFFASVSLISFSNNSTSELLPLIFLIGLYPILDMIFVISNRLLKGASPFNPDSNHFHHILRRNKLSHQKSVKVLYVINIFFCTLGIIGSIYQKLS